MFRSQNYTFAFFYFTFLRGLCKYAVATPIKQLIQKYSRTLLIVGFLIQFISDVTHFRHVHLVAMGTTEHGNGSDT